MRVQVSLRALFKGDGNVLSLFLLPAILHVNLYHGTLAASMDIRAHVVVSGVVQGVGFRYFVYHRAVRFGLAGYVRNTFSGEVEMEIQGDRSWVEELLNDVKVGPRSAHVKDLKIDWLPYEKSLTGFNIQ
jgi:acylphosphatase